jgi:GNAT superfamily N-acetyltransferase
VRDVATWRELRFAQADVPLPLRTQVLAARDQAWPSDDDDKALHDPALDPAWLVLVDDTGTVAASLAVLSKTITHRRRRYTASGLSAVVTDAGRRGQGHGLQLVAAARRMIADDGRDLGIFTCDRPLAGFYERAGWTVLPGAVLIGGTPAARLPSDQFDKVTVAAFCTEHARAHAREFEHARVELYPGLIDRLW